MIKLIQYNYNYQKFFSRFQGSEIELMNYDLSTENLNELD